jgi:hypothetical protein
LNFGKGVRSVAKSAVDVISTAFEHTRQQLTQPFRFGQWARLAVLGLATGELSSGGGCNSFSRSLGNLPSKIPNGSRSFADPNDVLGRLGLDPAVIASMIVVAVMGFLILGLIWLYVSSISRFVLFESVLRKRCELSASWSRWHGQGLRYFGWQLALSFVGLVVAAVLFLPLLLPVIAAMKNHQQPGPGLFLALLPMLFVYGIFAIVMALIAVLTKDFVIPLMAVDGVGVIEGWRRLLEMMKAEKGSYALYIVMKIVLAIGAAVVFGILSGILIFVLMVPVGIAGVAVYILGKGAHLSWDVFTITALIVAGTIVLSVLFYLVALVCVPVAVFFPAYAMYFIAERFPALRARLYPAPPVPVAPPGLPALPPLPEPIG